MRGDFGLQMAKTSILLLIHSSIKACPIGPVGPVIITFSFLHQNIFQF